MPCSSPRPRTLTRLQVVAKEQNSSRSKSAIVVTLQVVILAVVVVLVGVHGLRIIFDLACFCVFRVILLQSSLSELWSHNRLVSSSSSAALGRGGGAPLHVLPAAATTNVSSAAAFGFRFADSALAAAASPDVPVSVLNRRRNGVAVGGSNQGTYHRRSSSSA